MKSYSRKEFGDFGEWVAACILEMKGYEILHRNFRFDRAEVDIISSYRNTLVFTEVKTRKSNRHGYAEQFISSEQENRIAKAADYFIQESGFNGNIRFDIMVLVPGGPQVHIKDAFWHWS